MFRNVRNYGQLILVFVFCSAVLSWVTLYNGFPLVFADSGTYLSLIADKYIPQDRSVFYPLFIFPFHLFKSPWPIVFVQSFIVVFVLFLLIKALGLYRKMLHLTLLTVVLSFVTIIPWHVACIMPDVFTGLVIVLSFILMFQLEAIQKVELYSALVLFALCVSFHNSHILLSFSLMICGAVSLLLIRTPLMHIMKRSLFVLVPILAVYLTSSSLHFIAGNGFSLSPTSSYFIFARLIEDGPAREYLNKKCPDNYFEICNHLDVLNCDTLTSNQLLWDPSSPLKSYKTQNDAKKEIASIVKGTISEYPILILTKSINNTIRQFINCGFGNEFKPYTDDVMAIYTTIKYRFSDYFSEYKNSRQNKGHLNIKFFNVLYNVTLVISIMLIIGIMLFKAVYLKTSLYMLGIHLMCGLITNAFICGGLSGVFSRYQNRIIWLIPAYAILMILSIKPLKVQK